MTVKMTSEIIRGDDEQALYMRGMKPEYRNNGMIAFNISTNRCPMFSSYVNCMFENKSFKDLWEHMRIHNIDYSNEFDKDIFNKSIGMLQLLIKFDVNDVSSSKKKYAKKAEALYALGKEYGLLDFQLTELIDKDIEKVKRLTSRGIGLYY